MNELLIIAGPCAVESKDQIIRIAKKLKKLGINYLRGGAFKPRTNPDSFQGLGDEGIEYLLKAKRETGIKIVTELMTIEQVKKFANVIDIIQIGSRNMYNYELLKELSKYDKPVILKRAFSATYNEWINASKYINNCKVILCERGIRNFDNSTRNTLDIQSIPYIKNNTNNKIIIDPSHASGYWYLVEPLAKAAIAAGADGLMIEVHNDPQHALSDGQQSVKPELFDTIMKKVKVLAEMEGKSL